MSLDPNMHAMGGLQEGFLDPGRHRLGMLGNFRQRGFSGCILQFISLILSSIVFLEVLSSGRFGINGFLIC